MITQRSTFSRRRGRRGCDGLGEMTSLKDEFKGALDEMIEYCRGKSYIGNNIPCDIDSMADEILKTKED